MIEEMRDRFSKTIGNWYMTSVSIKNVREGSEYVMAELIDLISTRDIHPDNGLTDIKFSSFYE